MKLHIEKTEQIVEWMDLSFACERQKHVEYYYYYCTGSHRGRAAISCEQNHFHNESCATQQAHQQIEVNKTAKKKKKKEIKAEN